MTFGAVGPAIGVCGGGGWRLGYAALIGEGLLNGRGDEGGDVRGCGGGRRVGSSSSVLASAGCRHVGVSPGVNSFCEEGKSLVGGGGEGDFSAVGEQSTDGHTVQKCFDFLNFGEWLAVGEGDSMNGELWCVRINGEGWCVCHFEQIIIGVEVCWGEDAESELEVGEDGGKYKERGAVYGIGVLAEGDFVGGPEEGNGEDVNVLTLRINCL